MVPYYINKERKKKKDQMLSKKIHKKQYGTAASTADFFYPLN